MTRQGMSDTRALWRSHHSPASLTAAVQTGDPRTPYSRRICSQSLGCQSSIPSLSAVISPFPFFVLPGTIVSHIVLLKSLHVAMTCSA